MPTDVPDSTSSVTTADAPEELQRWISVLIDAHARGAHVDVVILGESDGATATCWSSSCPAADQKAEFLRWLASTVADADAFFVPEQDQ